MSLPVQISGASNRVSTPILGQCFNILYCTSRANVEMVVNEVGSDKVLLNVTNLDQDLHDDERPETLIYHGTLDKNLQHENVVFLLTDYAGVARVPVAAYIEDSDQYIKFYDKASFAVYFRVAARFKIALAKLAPFFYVPVFTFASYILAGTLFQLDNTALEALFACVAGGLFSFGSYRKYRNELALLDEDFSIFDKEVDVNLRAIRAHGHVQPDFIEQTITNDSDDDTYYDDHDRYEYDSDDYEDWDNNR